MGASLCSLTGQAQSIHRKHVGEQISNDMLCWVNNTPKHNHDQGHSHSPQQVEQRHTATKPKKFSTDVVAHSYPS
jgi:hypothetical protein